MQKANLRSNLKLLLFLIMTYSRCALLALNQTKKGTDKTALVAAVKYKTQVDYFHLQGPNQNIGHVTRILGI